MAKIAKKKGGPEINPRSRAAKRATSPGIDIDKSIKDAPRATDATPVLAVNRGGGISKKKKTKQMTRGQRARQEKGLSRAEAVMDQMARKVEGASSRKKKIDHRRAAWDDINDASKEETRKAIGTPGQETVKGKQEEQDIDTGGDVGMNGYQVPGSLDDVLKHEDNTEPSLNAKDEVDLID